MAVRRTSWPVVTQMVRYASLRLLVVRVIVTLVLLFPPLVSQRLHSLSRVRRLCFFVAHKVRSTLLHSFINLSLHLRLAHSLTLLGFRGLSLSGVTWTVLRVMSGDQYIGRGSRQRKLEKSQFSNPYKVCEYGRENAIRLFEQYLDSSSELISQVHSLSGKRLVCHCGMNQTCHGDALIRKFRELHPDAFVGMVSVSVRQRRKSSTSLRHTDRSPLVTTALQPTTASQQRTRDGSDKGPLFR